MKKCVVSGIIVVLLLLLFQSGSAEQINGSSQENPWNGTWVDSMYTMYIQQDGSTIHGIYEPIDLISYDPGRLEGTLSENGTVFSGKWIESGGSTWNLSDDKTAFNAIGKNDQIEGLSVPITYEFNGTRTGEIQDQKNIWSGEWVSTQKKYNITQDGASIQGVNHPLPDAEDEDGIFEGTVADDGNSFAAKWTETGNFSFNLSKDGDFFNGTYSVDLSESNVSDTWNMTKVQ